MIIPLIISRSTKYRYSLNILFDKSKIYSLHKYIHSDICIYNEHYISDNDRDTKY